MVCYFIDQQLNSIIFFGGWVPSVQKLAPQIRPRLTLSIPCDAIVWKCPDFTGLSQQLYSAPAPGPALALALALALLFCVKNFIQHENLIIVYKYIY